eukprot:m.44081 g.44081  ORF g.44081 m.44081 type:complete len:275 (+) comp10046_c0_seq2:165-989(+)
MSVDSQPIKIEPLPALHGEETDENKINPCAMAAGILCFPATLCCSWYTVRERTHNVKLHCGTYTGTDTESGCHFSNCFGRQNFAIPTGIISNDLPQVKVIEQSGSPIMCGAVVTYRIVNAKRAALDVQNYKLYIKNKALSVLKQVVSRYPYQPPKDNPDQPSLMTETRQVSREMETLFAIEVAKAGAEVVSFQLNEISYAPEIANAMLKRQQAVAVIEAREAIVKGAVTIALTSIDSLKSGGIEFSDADKAKLVSNLLVVTSSDQGASPVVNVS